jgi:hypothetical protein
MEDYFLYPHGADLQEDEEDNVHMEPQHNAHWAEEFYQLVTAGDPKCAQNANQNVIY